MIEFLRFLPNNGVVVAILAVMILMFTKQEKSNGQILVVITALIKELTDSRIAYMERLDHFIELQIRREQK